MRLYNLSGGKLAHSTGSRGLAYSSGSTKKGSGLLLQKDLGASTAGYGMIKTVNKPVVAPVQDTSQLQSKLAGLSKLQLSGKKKYVNL